MSAQIDYTPPYIYVGLWEYEQLMALPDHDAHVRAYRQHEDAHAARMSLLSLMSERLGVSSFESEYEPTCCDARIDDIWIVGDGNGQ